MHDLMLSVSYESLGKILEQLSAAPEVQAAPRLAEQIGRARVFHQQLVTEFQGILREQQELREQLSALTREPGERLCGDATPGQFGKYERLRDSGAAPREVYLAAKDEGLDDLSALRILRQVFQFSLPEAQAVAAEAAQEMLQHASP